MDGLGATDKVDKLESTGRRTCLNGINLLDRLPDFKHQLGPNGLYQVIRVKSINVPLCCDTDMTTLLSHVAGQPGAMPPLSVHMQIRRRSTSLP